MIGVVAIAGSRLPFLFVSDSTGWVPMHGPVPGRMRRVASSRSPHPTFFMALPLPAVTAKRAPGLIDMVKQGVGR